MLSAVIACGVVITADGQKPDKGIETFDTVWRLVNECRRPAAGQIDGRARGNCLTPCARRESPACYAAGVL
jgi:hypothetical protein